jgi:hypothetical protein
VTNRFLNSAACALIAMGALAFAGQAQAACTVIAATNSGPTKGSALAASQRAVETQAQQLKSQRGWRSVSISARKVKADPFWKAVRPVVPPEIIIKPDVRTAHAHTTCWPGVVVPFVCTSGARICGR